MWQKAISAVNGGGAQVKVGTFTVPSGSDTCTITDIGFEPSVFMVIALRTSSPYEYSYDNWSDNTHYYYRSDGAGYNTTRVTAKSASSLTWDNPISGLRGATLTYVAIQ